MREDNMFSDDFERKFQEKRNHSHMQKIFEEKEVSINTKCYSNAQNLPLLSNINLTSRNPRSSSVSGEKRENSKNNSYQQTQGIIINTKSKFY